MSEEQLKQLWQAQAAATTALPLHELRQRADSFQRRIGRRNRIEYAAGAVVVLWFGVYLWLFPAPLMRLGSALTLVAALFVMWQLHHRAASQVPPAEHLGLPLVQFHRAALVRQRDALRDAWRWYVLPFVPGVALFMWGLQAQWPAPRLGAAVDITLAALALGVAALNRHAARQLQAQIDAIDRLQAQAA
jgi:hypothetical protein